MARTPTTFHYFRMQALRWLRKFFSLPTLGERGERLAARYLQKQGMIIVARGARTSIGEIDLVAVENRKTVVFVEVKTREHDRAGLPAEAVDDRKQRKLTRLAMQYIARNDLQNYSARFDVISILLPPGGKPLLEHIPNAFDAADI